MKKGFTLIEVLAVILAISLITLLVVPNILNSVNNKKSNISETARDMIYKAADLYITDNSTSYPIDEDVTYCIKIEELVNSGKLTSPVKDLKNNKEVPLNYYVKATVNDYNQFDYDLVNNRACTPTIAYYITDENRTTSEKTITIKYPQSNYVKKYRILSGTTKDNTALNTDITVTTNPSITFTSNGSIKFWVEDGEVIGEKTVNITKIGS